MLVNLRFYRVQMLNEQEKNWFFRSISFLGYSFRFLGVWNFSCKVMQGNRTIHVTSEQLWEAIQILLDGIDLVLQTVVKATKHRVKRNFQLIFI